MVDIAFLIYAFTSLFAIVNPVSGVMVFISMTTTMSKEDKIYTARRSVLIAGVIAIVFSILGELILIIFNITADSLRVAGGVLLFLVAIDMLFARTSRESITNEELKDAKIRENISVFPIAMPLLTGPGAITTIIVLIRTGQEIGSKLMVIVAIVITFLLTYFIFRYADSFNKVVGVTGMLVTTRIMGLFLAAIAVDFISTGIKGIFNMG
ncbi:MAG: MarC family protein [Euryarchaeota archaeon]|nr:MarC family protein [Euryarchaeota archaeon]MBU4076831.1 MarC family protein [Euryarchaeota archaeon]MBU4138720.1 MarC family protein [Euryarchaeota archaeon]